MLENLTRGGFNQEEEVLKDLRQISASCGILGIHHDLKLGYIEELSKSGVFQRQPDIYTRLQNIAKNIGYSGEQRPWKSTTVLRQLFADSGIPAVAKLIRQQIESILIESNDLSLRLPNLSPNLLPDLIRWREHIRNYPPLYSYRSAKETSACEELEYMTEYKGWIENSLTDPNQSTGERWEAERLLGLVETARQRAQTETNQAARKRRKANKQRLKRLGRSHWRTGPSSEFSFDFNSGSPRLHFKATLRDGSFKSSILDLDLSTLEDQVILTGRHEDDPLKAEAPGGTAHDFQIFQELSKLGVRHIPRIFKRATTQTGSKALLVEHFRGRDAQLRLHHDFQKGFDEPVFSIITRCLLEHLCDLHRHRYLHRDIKPANILLQEVGRRATLPKISAAAVTDFGFSCHLPENSQFVHTDLGTPQYAAPEIWEWNRASTKTDMWAAGATLFELRYGYPFLTNLRGVQRAKAYTTELIGRSSELPQSPPELQEYYTGRASQARARNMKIDTIDRFILELLQVKPSQRPSAEEALKHWEIIEKSLEADKWNTDPRMGL